MNPPSREYLKLILNRLALAALRIMPTASVAPGPAMAIIRADNLGDLVVFLPALEALYQRAGEKGLSLVVSEAAAGLAQGLPARGFPLLDVIVVDRRRFNADLAYKLRTMNRLRRRRFSQTIAPAISRDSIADTLLAATGAPQRLGWQRASGVLPARISRSYDAGYTRLEQCPDDLRLEGERNAALLLAFFGATAPTATPCLTLNAADRAAATEFLSSCGIGSEKFVIIAPGAGSPQRIWPLERFAAVADHLAAAGLHVMICASESERRFAAEIKRISRSSLLDLSGRTSVFLLAALLERAALCVGNESGPIHIAAAVGCPIVCVMGGGHPGRFFPHEISGKQIAVFDPAAPCLHDDWACLRGLRPEETAPCLASIPTAAILAAIDRALAA